MAQTLGARDTVVLGVERAALAIRYVVWLALTFLYLGGWLGGEWSDFVILSAVVLIHNALVHGIIWLERKDFFFSIWNFIVYYIESSLIVGLTGPDSGLGFIVYLWLIIGAGAYIRSFAHMMAITGVLGLTYIALLLIEYEYVGISVSSGVLAVKLIAIFVTGWLMGRVAVILWRMEEQAFAHEQASISSEATLRSILNNAANPIVVFDENENLRDVNDRACTFLNAPRDALLDQRFRRFIFDDGTWPNKMSTLRKRGAYHGEELFVDEDGEERNVDLRIRSYRGKEGQFFVAVWHDISDQKVLDEARRLAAENAARLKLEIEHLSSLRHEFVASVTRKLRSPLSAVYGYIDILLNEELGNITVDQRKALQACRRAVKRLFPMMDKLTADERVTAPHAEEHAEPEESSHHPS